MEVIRWGLPRILDCSTVIRLDRLRLSGDVLKSGNTIKNQFNETFLSHSAIIQTFNSCLYPQLESACRAKAEGSPCRTAGLTPASEFEETRKDVAAEKVRLQTWEEESTSSSFQMLLNNLNRETEKMTNCRQSGARLQLAGNVSETETGSSDESCATLMNTKEKGESSFILGVTFPGWCRSSE